MTTALSTLAKTHFQLHQSQLDNHEFWFGAAHKLKFTRTIPAD